MKKVLILIALMPLYSCATTMADITSKNPDSIYNLISESNTEKAIKILKRSKKYTPVEQFYLIKRAVRSCNKEILVQLLEKVPNDFFNTNIDDTIYFEQCGWGPQNGHNCSGYKIKINNPGAILLMESFEAGCQDAVELLSTKNTPDSFYCAIMGCECYVEWKIDSEFKGNWCQGLSETFYDGVYAESKLKDEKFKKYKSLFDFTIEKLSKDHGSSGTPVKKMKDGLQEAKERSTKQALAIIQEEKDTACSMYNCILVYKHYDYKVELMIGTYLSNKDIINNLKKCFINYKQDYKEKTGHELTCGAEYNNIPKRGLSADLTQVRCTGLCPSWSDGQGLR